jgi:hypothetical protein
MMKARITNDAWRMDRSGVPGGHSSFVIRHSSFRHAFTLLEVIVACAIFFMVAFAILELVATNLKAARKLQTREPDPGIILHSLSLSNRLEEGEMSGDYEDIAPGMYPGYRWIANIAEVGSNGLFQVDVATYNDRKAGKGIAVVGTQFWRPNSKPGSATKGRP